MSETAKPKRKPRPSKGKEFGILNPYGDIWTFQSFETPEEARQHLDGFWRGIGSPQKAEGFRIVRVNVATSYAGEVE